MDHAETRASGVLTVLLRVATAAALVLGAWALWLWSGAVLRMLCGAACLIFTGGAISFARGRGARTLVLSGVAVSLLTVSPIEVSCTTRDGWPGVVAVLPGLPSARGLERARRGEVVLLGCIVTGLEPRWVVIW